MHPLVVPWPLQSSFFFFLLEMQSRVWLILTLGLYGICLQHNSETFGLYFTSCHILKKKKKMKKGLIIFSLKSWQVLIRQKFKLLLMPIWLSGISSCLYAAEWNIKLSHDWPLSDFEEGLGRLEALDWRDRGESSKSPRPSSCPKSSDLRHHKEKGRFPCAMRKGRPKPPSHPRRPPCCKIFCDSPCSLKPINPRFQSYRRLWIKWKWAPVIIRPTGCLMPENREISLWDPRIWERKKEIKGNWRFSFWSHSFSYNRFVVANLLFLSDRFYLATLLGNFSLMFCNSTDDLLSWTSNRNFGSGRPLFGCKPLL